MTYDDPKNHDRRQEVRRGGISNEELPYAKKSKGKPRKRIDHKHEWVEEYREEWYHTKPVTYIVCKVCGKNDWPRSRYVRKTRKEW